MTPSPERKGGSEGWKWVGTAGRMEKKAYFPISCLCLMGDSLYFSFRNVFCFYKFLVITKIYVKEEKKTLYI